MSDAFGPEGCSASQSRMDSRPHASRDFYCKSTGDLQIGIARTQAKIRVVKTSTNAAIPDGGLKRGDRWVLVTDGARGQALSALAAVRASAAAGYRAAVTVSGPHSLAAASRHCSRRIPAPLAEAEDFAPTIEAAMDRDPYSAVLPASDAALLALGAPVDELVDKVSLARAAEAVGLEAPPTEIMSAEELLSTGDGLPFPVVIKAAGGGLVRQATDPAGLAVWSGHRGDLLVQRYMGSGLRSLAGVIWGGQLRAAVHQRYIRIWPPDCGGASAAETIEPDFELEKKISQLLKDFDGIFHAQLIGPYLLDLNPRVYGSMPLALSAGVNLVKIYCDLLQGGEAPEIVRARPGVFYRSLEGDLRHAIRAVKHDRRHPDGVLEMLRPRRGAAHATESLTDPGPMLARLRFAAGSGRLAPTAHSGISP